MAAGRDRPRERVRRAGVVLATAEGLGTAAVMRRAGVSEPCAWRRRGRSTAEGVDGLLRDEDRPPGTPAAAAGRAGRAVRLTPGEPPGGTTRRTGRATAEAAGVSPGPTRATWKAHGLVPHRARTLDLPRDPELISKPRDIVGLHTSPPAHGLVPSADERGRIQALGRTRPGRPMGEGRPAAVTRDHERSGTTTLPAALNVPDGAAPGRCTQRHRRREPVRAILNNHAARERPEARARLARHPRRTFRPTPAERRLRRGGPGSPVGPRAATNRCLEQHDAGPGPFA